MPTKEKVGIEEIIEPDIYKEITSLFEKIKSDSEFEIMILGRNGKYISQEKYIQILKIFNKRLEMDKSFKLVQPNDVLDINYKANDTDNYRCSIEGQDNINKLMKKLILSRNHVVFKTLLTTNNYFFHEKRKK